MHLVTYRRYDIRLGLLSRAVGRVFGGWRFVSFDWSVGIFPNHVRVITIEVIWSDERANVPTGAE